MSKWTAFAGSNMAQFTTKEPVPLGPALLILVAGLDLDCTNGLDVRPLEIARSTLFDFVAALERQLSP